MQKEALKMKLTQLKSKQNIENVIPDESLHESVRSTMDFASDDEMVQAKRDFAIEQTKKSKHVQHAAHKISKFD